MESTIVKIRLPVVEGPVHSESCGAEPVDIAAGHYRLTNVPMFADVGFRDVVRCEPGGDGRLIAVEIVERSHHINVVLVPALEGDDTDEPGHGDADPASLLDRLWPHFGDRLTVEGGLGLLAVALDPELLDELLDAIADAGSGTRDDDAQVAGSWRWFISASPGWDQPEPLPGADDLLAEPGPDVWAIDWPDPDDELVARWPPELVEHLRVQAATDDRLRAALDDRRYLAAIAPDLRRQMAGDMGVEAVGPQPFPLFPADERDAEPVPSDRWLAAHERGRVRWAVDDEVDAIFRETLTSLGLDPDQDPLRSVDA